MIAVLPSDDSATAVPKAPGADLAAAGELAALLLQPVPLRRNSHAAPASPLSSGPPIRALVPSPASATS